MSIAVDGPASSGKGTVARAVARLLGYQYVDTGAMYRSVALRARRAGIDWSDPDGLAAIAKALVFEFVWNGDVLHVVVDGEDVTTAIRSAELGGGASTVSAHPAVRTALLGLQRDLGHRGGVVMDGRDIGTVVLPDADVKVYLDAALEERALRRHEELLRAGETLSFHEVKAQLAARDKADMERAVAPLRRAEDAFTIDSSNMTIRQAVDAVLAVVARVDARD
jgi:cytidylate kinase